MRARAPCFYLVRLGAVGLLDYPFDRTLPLQPSRSVADTNNRRTSESISQCFAKVTRSCILVGI